MYKCRFIHTLYVQFLFLQFKSFKFLWVCFWLKNHKSRYCTENIMNDDQTICSSKKNCIQKLLSRYYSPQSPIQEFISFPNHLDFISLIQASFVSKQTFSRPKDQIFNGLGFRKNSCDVTSRTMYQVLFRLGLNMF